MIWPQSVCSFDTRLDFSYFPLHTVFSNRGRVRPVTPEHRLHLWIHQGSPGAHPPRVRPFLSAAVPSSLFRQSVWTQGAHHLTFHFQPKDQLHRGQPDMGLHGQEGAGGSGSRGGAADSQRPSVWRQPAGGALLSGLRGGSQEHQHRLAATRPRNRALGHGCLLGNVFGHQVSKVCWFISQRLLWTLTLPQTFLFPAYQLSSWHCADFSVDNFGQRFYDLLN